MSRHPIARHLNIHMTWRVALICSLVAMIVASTAVLVFRSENPSNGASLGKPFATNSPWNTAISWNAALDPNSSAMSAYASRNGRMYASMREFGIPIYAADAQTPKYTVQCTQQGWGTCPFSGYQVPIPNGAKPHTGSDGAMVVVDQGANRIYEFWRANQSGSQWTTQWGAVNRLDGSGWGGASTGSGASRLAGVIRLAEIRNGVIPHALAVQTDNICAGIFRSPALKTDGPSTRSDCIPEGARLRLDPTLNLSTLNLAPGVRAVAKAMQQYGAYAMDVGGTSLSVAFELDTQAPAGSIGQVYTNAGLRWDYDGMESIPWKRLQVLR